MKSNIFFALCQTSFLNSTKCDFNTFLIKHYYVHQNVWVLLKCRGHCLRIVLLNFTRNTATQILNLNISPPPPHSNKNIQSLCWSLLSAPARQWTTLIHWLSEGTGHWRIGVLWERKYKTYFVKDSIATYASLKIFTKGIFSWKAWWNNKHLQLSYETRRNKLDRDWWWSS